ncbi:MAG: hypothetical protein ACXVP0_07455 [Bacteroidia bacterium]
MKKLFVLMLCSCFTFTAGALVLKKDSAVVKKKKLTGFYFNLQGNFMNDVALSPKQMASVWPGVSSQTYSAFPQRYGSGAGTQGAITELGISLNNGSRGKFQTQIGICYNSMRSVGRAYSYSLMNPIDSLVSSAGYPTLYRDSIYSKTYDVNYYASYFGLSLGETCEFQLAKRFGLLLGAGVKAMYSINPQLSEFSYTNQYVYLGQTKDPLSQGLFPKAQDYSTDAYTSSERLIPGAKSSMMFLANLSAGCNFRLFTLKKSHHSLWLSQSVNSGIDVLKLNGISAISRFYFGVSMGLKFTLG